MREEARETVTKEARGGEMGQAGGVERDGPFAESQCDIQSGQADEDEEEPAGQRGQIES